MQQKGDPIAEAGKIRMVGAYRTGEGLMDLVPGTKNTKYTEILIKNAF